MLASKNKLKEGEASQDEPQKDHTAVESEVPEMDDAISVVGKLLQVGDVKTAEQIFVGFVIVFREHYISKYGYGAFMIRKYVCVADF